MEDKAMETGAETIQSEVLDVLLELWTIGDDTVKRVCFGLLLDHFGFDVENIE